MEKEMLVVAKLKEGTFEKFMGLCNLLRDWQKEQR